MKKRIGYIGLTWTLAVLCFYLAYASSSINACGTATNSGTGTSWSNLTNISADDATYVAISAARVLPKDLLFTNFGFAIPSTDVIDSITARIDCYTGGAITTTNVFQMLKAGTGTGTDNGSWVDWSVTSETTYLLSGGVWGTTWTYSDVNASNFGCWISVASSEAVSWYIDYVQLTVYYHTPTATSKPHVIGMSQTRTATVMR